jgi:hypothetical protein
MCFTLGALIDLIGSAVLVYGGEDIDGEVALQVMEAAGLIVPDPKARTNNTARVAWTRNTGRRSIPRPRALSEGHRSFG